MRGRDRYVRDIMLGSRLADRVDRIETYLVESSAYVAVEEALRIAELPAGRVDQA